jgi:hypothetical protein
MSEQKFDADSVVLHVHGQVMKLNPANGYVHGAITTVPQGKAVVTVQRDEATGRVNVRIDKK